MFVSELLENSKCVCLVPVPNQVFSFVLGVYKLPIQWINLDLGFTISEKCFLPHTSPSSLSLERRVMVLNLSFCWWCYHREECSHCPGICKLPPLWDLSTNFAPHSVTVSPLYFMKTISTPFPSSHPSRITWASISLFTHLLGPYNTIKPNYPKNSYLLSALYQMH